MPHCWKLCTIWGCHWHGLVHCRVPLLDGFAQMRKRHRIPVHARLHSTQTLCVSAVCSTAAASNMSTGRRDASHASDHIAVLSTPKQSIFALTWRQTGQFAGRGAAASVEARLLEAVVRPAWCRRHSVQPWCPQDRPSGLNIGSCTPVNEGSSRLPECIQPTRVLFMGSGLDRSGLSALWTNCSRVA